MASSRRPQLRDGETLRAFIDASIDGERGYKWHVDDAISTYHAHTGTPWHTHQHAHTVRRPALRRLYMSTCADLAAAQAYMCQPKRSPDEAEAKARLSAGTKYKRWGHCMA